MWSESHGLHIGQKSTRLKTKQSACWESVQTSAVWTWEETRGLCEPGQHPLPLQAHSLALSCDLNTGLEDSERAGGLDLPMMPYDKPLTSLTPSNITPLKGLSAYWLKNKKGDQKTLQALDSLGQRSTSCLTLTPRGNVKEWREEGRWKESGSFQVQKTVTNL